MSGKAYTMREMKTIVDYLTEHRVYGEIKARKMWVNFANSKVTNRTWQSLKETFLKRILPDIHNPYYKLTMEQICSFRQGYDVEKQDKNKLDIQRVSEDSNTNAEIQTDHEQPSTSNNNNGEKAAGEDIKCSKIPPRHRSSADTLVLDNFYETAEEIQMELESPKGKNIAENHDSVAKTLRDFITYSEPLTPMLQEVLDDFATESEGSDKEPQMQIVDEVSPDTNHPDTNDQRSKSLNDNSNTRSTSADIVNNAEGLASEVVEEVLLSEMKDTGSQLLKIKSLKLRNRLSHTTENENSSHEQVEVSMVHDEQGKENNLNTKPLEEAELTVLEKTTENTGATQSFSKNNSVGDNTASGKNNKSAENCSNTTTDTVLPNNQEAFEKGTQRKHTQEEIKDTQEIFDSHIKSGDKTSLKRSNPNNDKVKKKSKLENHVKPIDADKKHTTTVIEINSENGDSKDPVIDQMKQPDASFETHDITETPCNIDPSTSGNLNEAEEAKSHSEDKTQNNESQQNKNPCLKSVSLFAEQFNMTKYTDSDSSDVEITTTNNNASTTLENKDDNTKDLVIDIINKDVVILKSHSESESHHDESTENKSKSIDRVSKTQRNQALANLFGFSSGGVTSSRKQQLSCHRRSKANRHSHSHNNIASASSEWTSESESDMYVSPPRGRKNRQTRKYLKPKSARILSLEEEGGLFVMHGKKIYPLVKDGKIVKNYLTFLPESGSEEEEESYWRQKYVEEKKRAEELKKLLEQAKEPKPRETSSPILPTNALRKSIPTRSRYKHSPQSSINSNGKELSLIEHKDVEKKDQHSEEKIKIKFTKNNEEVHLEGHWPQIHPVLEQVVQIFHKESDIKVKELNPKTVLELAEPTKEISGQTTPIPTSLDPEIREKVDKIESEIFKQIEELDKEDHSKENGSETNVTRRKGRSRKASSSTTSAPSPAKRLRRSKQSDPKEKAETASKTRVTESEKDEKEGQKINQNEDYKKNQNGNRRSTRLSRTPKNNINETAATSIDVPKTLRTRKSKLKESVVNNATVEDNDADVRYMLPPAGPVQKSPVNNSKTKERKTNRSLAKMKLIASPNTLSRCSTESTQGYQDSDISPTKLNLHRKKRKMSVSTVTRVQRSKHLSRNGRRKSYPLIAQDASDSNNSSYFIPVKKNNTGHSSLNSEAYKSESYQLLRPQQKYSSRRLEIIDEARPISNEFIDKNIRYFNTVSKDFFDRNLKMNNSGQGNEIGSSSNVSLPQSPELSVVDHLSISKEFLCNIANHPTINETQANATIEHTNYNKYLISDIDISVPLMEQECELKNNNATVSRTKDDRIISAISESLLNKICTVNIEDNNTLSDSLDQKLRDLLLESARKMSKIQAENSKNNEMNMEVDVSKLDTAKKTMAKKRCSTPRKKKSTKKTKVSKIDPVVEEEHMESCSHGGRKSCPPLIQVISCEDNARNNENSNVNNLKNADKPKSRKKKDVIKVKILRPRERSLSKEKELHKSFEDCNNISACTDSGINDTVSMVFLHGQNESVDLIHNHSETCLHANECMGDSVEFVETSLQSVISLSNSLPSEGSEWQRRIENNMPVTVSADFFCNNAEDLTSFSTEDKTNTQNRKSPTDTLDDSHINADCNSSLITEDLSDETPSQKQSQPDLISPSKWYLLSEDESTNYHIPQVPVTSSFSAHLKQLFPVTCAVPDLSTITEMSDNSRKPTLEVDGITGNNYDSQRIND